MEDTKVIDVLYVAFLEVEAKIEFLAQEMQSIKCFGLGFCDRWNIRRARKT